MSNITDPQVVQAITLLHEGAKESERLAQLALDHSARTAKVASALHDLMLDAQARKGQTLRVVS